MWPLRPHLKQCFHHNSQSLFTIHNGVHDIFKILLDHQDYHHKLSQFWEGILVTWRIGILSPEPNVIAVTSQLRSTASKLTSFGFRAAKECCLAHLNCTSSVAYLFFLASYLISDQMCHKHLLLSFSSTFTLLLLNWVCPIHHTFPLHNIRHFPRRGQLQYIPLLLQWIITFDVLSSVTAPTAAAKLYTILFSFCLRQLFFQILLWFRCLTTLRLTAPVFHNQNTFFFSFFKYQVCIFLSNKQKTVTVPLQNNTTMVYNYTHNNKCSTIKQPGNNR